jgi:alkaline phosphatase D
MSWLDQASIRGVLFVSGDRHMSELLIHRRPWSYPLYEFTSSPLTAGVSSRLTSEKENEIRVPGTLVNDHRNFGVIEVTGTRRDRSLLLKAVDADGKVRWEHRIHQSELGWPDNR